MAAFRSLRYAVEACNFALGASEIVLQRRAYHWRGMGKVLPNGPGYTQGTGNSRRYHEATIPLIAVLLQISSKYPSVEELDAISRTIQRNLAEYRTPFARCWTAALARAVSEQKIDSEEYTRIGAPPNKAISPDPDVQARLTEIQKETHWLTIAFPSPSRGEFAVRCGPTVIINQDEDIDIYALDLDFIFYGLAEFKWSNS